MLNQNLKHYFIGISLSPISNTETGIAVLDKNMQIITLDKAFSVQDIYHFLDNFPSLKNSVITVSMADDVSLLNSKWKVIAKKFQFLANNDNFANRNNWKQKHTNRGCELFLQYKKSGIDIFRFSLSELKKTLSLSGIYKERSSADCKYLQNALKVKFFMENIMSNMLPASQLEAILGGILAHKIYYGEETIDYKILYSYNGIEVVNLTADNVSVDL